LCKALDISNVDISRKGKRRFLKEFKERNYFLIDIFPTYEEKQDFEHTDYGEGMLERRKTSGQIIRPNKRIRPRSVHFHSQKRD